FYGPCRRLDATRSPEPRSRRGSRGWRRTSRHHAPWRSRRGQPSGARPTPAPSPRRRSRDRLNGSNRGARRECRRHRPGALAELQNPRPADYHYAVNSRVVLLACLAATGGLVSLAATQSGRAPEPSRHWYKGNTHTHTLNSDGDSTPDDVVKWYREHG